MTLPSHSGCVVHFKIQRDPGCAHRRDAARVQDAAARGRDLLGFAVMQALDQARRRYGLRVGAEEARRVGPDLEPARFELAGEVGARGVGAAAAEQHGVALRVARDEALRHHDALIAAKRCCNALSAEKSQRAEMNRARSV